jgi:hypothetical protein
MIEVHLYGNLRRCAPEPRPDRENVVQLEPETGQTVGTLLDRLNIPPGEVHHIFLNRALLSTRSTMALWLGYRQTEEGPLGRDLRLEEPVRAGDRVALFGHDMALLVI